MLESWRKIIIVLVAIILVQTLQMQKSLLLGKPADQTKLLGGSIQSFKR